MVTTVTDRGGVIAPQDVDADQLPETLARVHAWCLDHVQTDHGGIVHYADLMARRYVLVCEGCGRRLDVPHYGGLGLEDVNAAEIRSLVNYHVRWKLDHGPDRVPVRRRLVAWARRQLPRVRLALDLLVLVVATWAGLDAYLSGFYELALALGVVMIWALAGLLAVGDA